MLYLAVLPYIPICVKRPRFLAAYHLKLRNFLRFLQHGSRNMNSVKFQGIGDTDKAYTLRADIAGSFDANLYCLLVIVHYERYPGYIKCRCCKAVWIGSSKVGSSLIISAGVKPTILYVCW